MLPDRLYTEGREREGGRRLELMHCTAEKFRPIAVSPLHSAPHRSLMSCQTVSASAVKKPPLSHLSEIGKGGKRDENDDHESAKALK